MNDGKTDPEMEDAGLKWAHLYVAACIEVLDAANACLEVANHAVAARNMAEERPQHEMSIKNFTKDAEQKEQEFAPLYDSFKAACANARDIAAQFLAAQTEYQHELVLMFNFQEGVLDNVATAKAILRANYGPTPASFIRGVQESNELIENPDPDGGNIYTPAAPTKRTCPWCAETIKAAAIICRFCGRDVQAQANTDLSG